MNDLSKTIADAHQEEWYLLKYNAVLFTTLSLTLSGLLHCLTHRDQRFCYAAILSSALYVITPFKDTIQFVIKRERRLRKQHYRITHRKKIISSTNFNSLNEGTMSFKSFTYMRNYNNGPITEP